MNHIALIVYIIAVDTLIGKNMNLHVLRSNCIETQTNQCLGSSYTFLIQFALYHSLGFDVDNHRKVLGNLKACVIIDVWIIRKSKNCLRIFTKI